MLCGHHHQRLLAASIELDGTIRLDLAFSCTLAGGGGVGGWGEGTKGSVSWTLVLSLLTEGGGSLNFLVLHTAVLCGLPS